MKKITTLIVALVVSFSFTTCNEDSLQGYLVKSQEKSGFITFDVPASLLQIKTDDVSEVTKATLNTLKKINIVALPFNNDNGAAVKAEKALLDKIFKDYKVKPKVKFIRNVPKHGKRANYAHYDFDTNFIYINSIQTFNNVCKFYQLKQYYYKV